MAVPYAHRGEINKVNADEDAQFIPYNEKQHNNINTKENAIKDEWKTITKNSKYHNKRRVK